MTRKHTTLGTALLFTVLSQPVLAQDGPSQTNGMCVVEATSLWIDNGNAYAQTLITMTQETDSPATCSEMCREHVFSHILPNVSLFDALGHQCQHNGQVLSQNIHRLHPEHPELFQHYSQTHNSPEGVTGGTEGAQPEGM